MPTSNKETVRRLQDAVKGGAEAIARVIDEGRIAEIRGVVDVFSQLRQLGVIPAP